MLTSWNYQNPMGPMEDTPPPPGPRAEGPWPPTRGAERAGRHEGICCRVRDGFGMDARRHGEKPNRSDGSAGTSQSSNIIPIIRLAVPSPGQRAAAPHSYHRRWVILYLAAVASISQIFSGDAEDINI